MTETAAVRAGDGMSLERLDACLRSQLPLADAPLVVEQFPHGHSNLTYLVRCGGDEWVLRRPPAGGVSKGAHDMERESRILAKLAGVYPLAPRPVLFCEDAAIVGAPFHLMERRHGIVLRAEPPCGGVAPAVMRGLCHALVQDLVKLHAIDVRAAGLGDIGRPEGYTDRQVSGWRRRYASARTDDLPALDRAGAWLAANVPGCERPSVVHNDYKFDNLLLDPGDLTRIVAVLDWEMATVGDGLTDLGTTLALWLEPADPEPLRAVRPSPTSWPGSLTRAELIALYVQLGGRPPDHPVFYYVYGLFKLAVIFQQSYARYVRGETADARFAAYPRKIAALADQALAVIARGAV